MSTMFKTDLSRYAFARPSELIPTRLGQETCLANLADRKRAPTRTLPAGPAPKQDSSHCVVCPASEGRQVFG